MARSFDGVDDTLIVLAAPVTVTPFTMACWFNEDVATAQDCLMSLGNAAGTDGHFLQADGSVAGDPVQAASRSGGASNAANTTTGFTVGTWHHAAGVWTSTTSRTAYIDGGSSATNTSESLPTAPTKTGIGVRVRDVHGNFFDGRIAEAAIWNVALTAAEVLLLARGYSPFFVRPGNLVAYWPLIGRFSPEIDVVGANNLTIVGAAVGVHMRMFYPVMPYGITAPAAAAAFGGEEDLWRVETPFPPESIVSVWG